MSVIVSSTFNAKFDDLSPSGEAMSSISLLSPSDRSHSSNSLSSLNDISELCLESSPKKKKLLKSVSWREVDLATVVLIPSEGKGGSLKQFKKDVESIIARQKRAEEIREIKHLMLNEEEDSPVERKKKKSSSPVATTFTFKLLPGNLNIEEIDSVEMKKPVKLPSSIRKSASTESLMKVSNPISNSKPSSSSTVSPITEIEDQDFQMHRDQKEEFHRQSILMQRNMLSRIPLFLRVPSSPLQDIFEE
jgi:hypothetical protein